jgi:hypothetical protein
MKEEIYTDMIFDIETLGNSGKFAVISVAFLPFNSHTKEVGTGRMFKISLEDSIKKGFVVNDSTVLWWLNQDINILTKLLTNGESIANTCYSIQKYLSEFKIDHFWASATLDYQGIENLFSACSMPNPITYDKRLCLRTIRALSETECLYTHPTYTHDPIEDCECELKEFFDQLGYIGASF